jgi:hypothetical protein
MRLNIGCTRLGCLARVVIVWTFSFCILLGSTIALYPGAKLDQEYERGKFNNPKVDSKQYITPDSFEKVISYYKKLAPEAPEWTMNQTGHKRMAFRERGDQKNSTTVEWSNEDPKDKDKTFIIVNSIK